MNSSSRLSLALTITVAASRFFVSFAITPHKGQFSAAIQSSSTAIGAAASVEPASTSARLGLPESGAATPNFGQLTPMLVATETADYASAERRQLARRLHRREPKPLPFRARFFGLHNWQTAQLEAALEELPLVDFIGVKQRHKLTGGKQVDASAGRGALIFGSGEGLALAFNLFAPPSNVVLWTNGHPPRYQYGSEQQAKR
ncbi:hypothetical protein OC835_006453 [Tilletia horrida]|uniref:Uncharacterized protein n=1 Tax=Tilletia horrida TaxID=155126 RepID=A0AAN6G6I4_9BASI|nr:hypothetical protein OC842_006812 [Tilletia horrida]KAK0522811.1 hypothetical protein OC835_006453 [Tilletia horrida]